METADPEQKNFITVRDAAAMFRRAPARNDRPHTRANKKENNKVVDRWQKDLLHKAASNDSLHAPVVMPLWNLYVGGTEIPSTMAYHEHTPTITGEQISFWRIFFEKTDIEGLWKLGKPVVGLGWSVIMNHVRFHDASQKFEEIYKDTEEPFEWYQRSLAKRDLFVNTDLPFWTPKQFQEIYELVTSFLAFRTGPQR